MKNLTELQGGWNETKGKLKQKFAILTDSDVLLVEGKKDEMLGRLQIKLGKTKEELQKVISALFIAGAILTSCNTPAEKVENAQEKVAEAHENLDEATENYLQDIENCRKVTAEQTAANDKSIAEFKARVEKEKKEVRDEYNVKIAELERKNSDMKKKINEYKEEGKENWEKFKKEFNHDMDELKNAFKDIAVNNTK